MRRTLSLVLGAVCAAGLVSCGNKDGKARPGGDDRLPRLETVPPLRGFLPVRAELACTVEPLEKADLMARVPGVVEHLPPEVDIGKRVSKGEELIRLAVPELDAQLEHKKALLEQARRQKALAEEACLVAAREVQEAQKQEKRYQAEFTRAKDKHDRTTALVQKGALQPEVAVETRSTLDAAESAWHAAKAQIDTRQAKCKAADADVQVAQSRIAVAEAEVKNLTAQVGYATIRAPFDGIVTKRWVDRGATIKDAGTPLLTVMHTDTVRVLIDIPERHVPLVNAQEMRPNEDGKGDPVHMRFPALYEVADEGEFSGTVCRISSALDPATRTMRAEVHLPNLKGHLRPSMQGTATILLEERYNVLSVPSTALVRNRQHVEVFIVADLQGNPPRGVVRRIPVELGLDDGKRVEVRKGLSGSERVIVKGNGVVRAGDMVIAVPLREP